jgi:hypothetical protein
MACGVWAYSSVALSEPQEDCQLNLERAQRLLQLRPAEIAHHLALGDALQCMEDCQAALDAWDGYLQAGGRARDILGRQSACTSQLATVDIEITAPGESLEGLRVVFETPHRDRLEQDGPGRYKGARLLPGPFSFQIRGEKWLPLDAVETLQAGPQSLRYQLEPVPMVSLVVPPPEAGIDLVLVRPESSEALTQAQVNTFPGSGFLRADFRGESLVFFQVPAESTSLTVQPPWAIEVLLTSQAAPFHATLVPASKASHRVQIAVPLPDEGPEVPLDFTIEGSPGSVQIVNIDMDSHPAMKAHVMWSKASTKSQQKSRLSLGLVGAGVLAEGLALNLRNRANVEAKSARDLQPGEGTEAYDSLVESVERRTQWARLALVAGVGFGGTGIWNGIKASHWDRAARKAAIQRERAIGDPVKIEDLGGP